MATLRTRDLTKSYSGRTVVRGVNLEHRVRRSRRPARAERRRQDHDVLHGRRADARPTPGACCSTARTSPTTRCTSGRARASATCRRSRRSSAGLTVEQNIIAILETLAARRRRRARARLRELLAELGLTPLAKSPAYTLSGGERRRVEITRALVISPKFILLDEPFAGIDPIAVTDIQKIIFHLKERGIGVLITDHNVRETLRITDRAYIVHDGVIFRSGTPDSLAADEEVKRIYLGADFRLD